MTAKARPQVTLWHLTEGQLLDGVILRGAWGAVASRELFHVVIENACGKQHILPTCLPTYVQYHLFVSLL